MRHKQVLASAEIIKSLNDWKREIVKSGCYIPFITVRKVNKIGRRHWIFCPLLTQYSNVTFPQLRDVTF
ncbi:hypothetical protein [Moritella viscosa]|uniref:hypothetical protein n=1 Tax=Moritella viscosa TaxID=80854 RepID=UPI00094CEA17|nr:hypothetical protein [Moritella viscosa]